MQNSMSATLRDIPMTSLTAFPDCLWRIHYLLIWKHPNASVCLFPRFGFHFISQLYSQRDPRWRGNFQFLVSDSHLFIASPSFTLFRRGLVWRSEVLVSIVEVGWNDPSIQIDFWCEAVTSYWQWKQCGNLARTFQQLSHVPSIHAWVASVFDVWFGHSSFQLCFGCFGLFVFYVCIELYICIYV